MYINNNNTHCILIIHVIIIIRGSIEVKAYFGGLESFEFQKKNIYLFSKIILGYRYICGYFLLLLFRWAGMGAKPLLDTFLVLQTVRLDIVGEPMQQEKIAYPQPLRGDMLRAKLRHYRGGYTKNSSSSSSSSSNSYKSDNK